jgi:hypothetical protein
LKRLNKIQKEYLRGMINQIAEDFGVVLGKIELTRTVEIRGGGEFVKRTYIANEIEASPIEIFDIELRLPDILLNPEKELELRGYFIHEIYEMGRLGSNKSARLFKKIYDFSKKHPFFDPLPKIPYYLYHESLNRDLRKMGYDQEISAIYRFFDLKDKHNGQGVELG